MVSKAELAVGTKVKIRGRGIAEVVNLKPEWKLYVVIRFDDGLESAWPLDQMSLVPAEQTRRGRRRPLFPDQETRYSPYSPAVHDLPVDIAHPDFLILQEFCIRHGQIIIGCSKGEQENAIAYFKKHGISDPEKYLRVGSSENPGGEWINLFIPDPGLPACDVNLRIFFSPMHLKSRGLYKIAKSEFVFNLLPQTCLLTNEEQIQPLEIPGEK